MTTFIEFIWEMRKFEFGITITPFNWRIYGDTQGNCFWLQIGPIAMDIGWGL